MDTVNDLALWKVYCDDLLLHILLCINKIVCGNALNIDGFLYLAVARTSSA